MQSTEIGCLEYSKNSKQEVKNARPAVRIDPNLIPSMEKTLLCATFLEAVIRFYQDPNNIRAFEEWSAKKGENAYGSKNS